MDNIEEISLKELLIILLKGYKLIVIFITCAALAAFGFGFLQPKVYNATSVLKVSDINMNSMLQTNNALTVGGLSSVIQVPVMNLDSYTQLITSADVLNRTIALLDIQDEEGMPVRPADLLDDILIESDKTNNMIHVNVQSRESVFAAQLSNTLSEQLIDYVGELMRKNGESIALMAEEQLVLQQAKMEETSRRLKAYYDGPYDPLEMEVSIASLTEQIAWYKTQVYDLKRAIQADEQSLAYLNTLQVDNEIPISMYQAPSELIIHVEDTENVSNALLSIKKAEMEARLIQNTADLQALTDNLAAMENNLTQLQLLYTDELQKYSVLQTDYQLAIDIFALYQTISQQVDMMLSSDIAHKNMSVLSEAFADNAPRYINLPLYVVVGILIGAGVGVFVVLFRDYWGRG